jgi:hypothetical protein
MIVAPVVKDEAAARKVGVGSVADAAERNCGATAVAELALRNAIWADTGALNAIAQIAQSAHIHAARTPTKRPIQSAILLTSCPVHA